MSFKKKSPAPTKNEQTEKSKIGLYAFKPNEGAPDFVLSNVILNIPDITNFIEENNAKAKSGPYGLYLKLQMLQSKEGNYYFKLDEYEKRQGI